MKLVVPKTILSEKAQPTGNVSPTTELYKVFIKLAYVQNTTKHAANWNEHISFTFSQGENCRGFKSPSHSQDPPN